MIKKDWDDLVEGQRGDWYFSREDTYITIRYGNNTMDVVTIPISVGTKDTNKWLWDGNKDNPTISPSIRILGVNGQPDLWHGWLKNGILETT